jgi:hypothetical protein
LGSVNALGHFIIALKKLTIHNKMNKPEGLGIDCALAVA